MPTAADGARVIQTVHRIGRLLPRGLPLPAGQWRVRHRLLLSGLAAHTPVLAVVGLFGPEPLTHVVGESALPLLFALAAIQLRSTAAKAVAVSLGWLTATYVLIHLTGGTTEAHFHFFISLPAVAFYQAWAPLLLALGTVVAHHLGMSVVDPASLFSTPAALANPIGWTFVHAAFVVTACLVQVVYWRLNEDAQILAARARASRDEADLTRDRERAALVDALTGRAATLTDDARDVDTSVQGMARAAVELDQRLRDVVDEGTRVRDAVTTAHDQVAATDDRLGEVDAASRAVAEMTDVIAAIASTTNMLALNATIEAARAGEAGRGFAVVAAEVRDLADQTRDAAARIGQHVEGMQATTATTSAAIAEVAASMGRIAASIGDLTGAVDAQVATGRALRGRAEHAAGRTRAIRGQAEGLVDLADVDDAAQVPDDAGDVGARGHDAPHDGAAPMGPDDRSAPHGAPREPAPQPV